MLTHIVFPLSGRKAFVGSWAEPIATYNLAVLMYQTVPADGHYRLIAARADVLRLTIPVRYPARYPQTEMVTDTARIQTIPTIEFTLIIFEFPHWQGLTTLDADGHRFTTITP